MKPIPIRAAKAIAKKYDYDQVIILGRKVGAVGESGEHMTTYGINKANCAAAERIGNFLKFQVMGWPKV